MSKVVERMVCRQLVAYVEQNGLLTDLQSAYRRCRSTETGVLKVVADLFTVADTGEVTLRSLLDLYAAFDTDKDVMIDRLYHAFGFRDDVLSWITSIVAGRTQRVRTVLVGSQYWTCFAVQYVMPQSNVLGPILFLLYTADVLVIAARHGVSVLHTPADNCEATFARLVAYIDNIGLWMSSDRPKLNAEKTQFTCLGTKYQLAKVDGSVLVANGSVVDLLPVVTCLGVTID